MSEDLKIKIPDEMQKKLNEMSVEKKLKIREEWMNEEDRKGTIRMVIIFAIIIIIGVLVSLFADYS